MGIQKFLQFRVTGKNLWFLELQQISILQRVIQAGSINEIISHLINNIIQRKGQNLPLRHKVNSTKL